MRIDIRRRRKGSLAIEALFILPVAVVVILLVRFLFEGAMTRHEVAVHARGSAVAAAAADSILPTHCRHDSSFITRTSVSKDFLVFCNRRDGETGLGQEKPIMEALKDGASAWPGILRDLENEGPFNDYQSAGQGSTSFNSPPFLGNQGVISNDAAYLSPSLKAFDHSDDPWKAAHEDAIWDELGGKTSKLFPNLFPARGG
jgi:hypothetical protein